MNIWMRRLHRATGWFLNDANNAGRDLIYSDNQATIVGDEFQQLLANLIISNKPFMVTRFGSTELTCIMDGLLSKGVVSIAKYLLHKEPYYGFRNNTAWAMETCSGFFPATGHNMLCFKDLILNIVPNIDVLATWMIQENIFEPYASNWKNMPRCRLQDLESFRFSNPWTACLKGKRVLIIHPFEATIRYQYTNNRTHLFENPEVLPVFDLKIIKAVQSIGGNRPAGFGSWFNALEYMERQIDATDFDIALVGCGAYGMPLADYCKRKGKQAVHIGGALQYFFGIKSKRADEKLPEVVKFYNEYWTRPFKEDTPSNYTSVEGGCYW